MDGRITYWNQGAEHGDGWTANEAVGRGSVELLYKEPSEYMNRRFRARSGRAPNATKALRGLPAGFATSDQTYHETLYRLLEPIGHVPPASTKRASMSGLRP